MAGGSSEAWSHPPSSVCNDVAHRGSVNGEPQHPASMREQESTDAQTDDLAPSNRLARAAVLLAVLAALALGGWRLYSASPERFVSELTHDDSFYFFQFSRNVARGVGLSFDGLEPTNGVTPVWAALLVPVFAVVEDADLTARTACLLSLALFALALFLLHRQFEPVFGPWPAAAAIIATVLAAPVRHVAMLGMDYSCNLLLHVLVIGAYLRLRKSGRLPTTVSLLGAGLLVGLNCIQRPDTSLLAVVLTVPILFAIQNRKLALRPGGVRSAALLIAGSLLVAVPYLVGCQLIFGDPMTVSGKLKTHNTITQLERDGFGKAESAFAYLLAGAPVEPALAAVGGRSFKSNRFGPSGRHFLLGFLVALAVNDGVRRRRARRSSARSSEPSPLPAIHAHAIVHMLVISIFLFPYIRYGNWYTAPEIMFGAALLAGALSQLARVLPTRIAPVVGFALMLLCTSGVIRDELRISARPPVPEQDLCAVSLPVAEYLREHLPPPARIGVFNAGRVGYYTDGHVVNLDGLINTNAFAEKVWMSGKKNFAGNFLQYVLEKDIQWFVDAWPNDGSLAGMNRYFPKEVRPFFSLEKSWPTDTTYATPEPGAYQLLHLDLPAIRKAIQDAGE